MRVALVLVCLLLAGCVTPPNTSTAAAPAAMAAHDGVPARTPKIPLGVPELDATLKGPLAWKHLAYDLGLYIVDDPTLGLYRYPLPINGSLVVPEGDGPFPLILLLHGRHGTCSLAGAEGFGTGFCPNAIVVEPVNSYQGYDYLAENLATHGYAVASLNANTINDRDLVGDSGANARAELLLRTLDEFRAINATGQSLPDATTLAAMHTDLSALKGRLDLSRIGMMGHSRGGEGVTRAITLNENWPQPHSIRAVFALAPTDFARWTAPNVAFAVLLPYCDGDVSDLQGGKIYDDSRDLQESRPEPKFQMLAQGADHNYYNTVWTSDDWGTRGDAHCDKAGRDSPDAQRLHGLHFMASFLRLFVGGERSFAPTWFDGTYPASLCPKGTSSCAGRFQVSANPTPADRNVIMKDAQGATGIDVHPCQPSPGCSGGGGNPTVGSAAQSVLTWPGRNDAVYHLQDVDLAGMSTLTFRAGVPTGKPGVPLDVILDSAGGQTTTHLEGGPLGSPPGKAAAKTILSEVRIPLTGLTGHLQTVTLRSTDGDRTLQLADLMLQR